MSDFEKHKAHLGPISQAAMDYVTNHVLLHSRYLFTKTAAGIQFAFCTHCKERHRPEDPLKHNTMAVCPKCHSTCTVKKSHVGRKYMFDKAYVVYYQKSILDPTIMTAMGFCVKRDYRGGYDHVETSYSPSCSYVFEMGHCTMFYTGYYDKEIWHQSKNIISEYSVYKNGTTCCYSRDSIKAAIKGTPFQYSAWENYDEQDMTKFLGLYSKYPCIEYLTKMGYEYFVSAKLYGFKTFNAIKWTGKSVNQMLKMDKQDFRRFKEQFPKILWDGNGSEKALALRLFQLTHKDSNRPDVGDLLTISRSIKGYFQELKPMLKYQNLMNCIAYINRQFKKKNGKKVYHDNMSVLITWKDYIDDCVRLGFDLSRENIVFPHDLYAAHESTISQVKIKVSQEEAEKIKNRAKELGKYRFAFNGFIIRAPISAKEIIEEGKSLRHCVGSYAQRHANGETSILVIRKVSDPDTPFYTMEVKGGKIIQTQGYKHCIPNGDIASFVEAFRSEKLEKKRSAARVKNQTKLVERQEAVV